MIKFTKLIMVFSLLLSLPLGALNAAHHELGNGVQSNAPFSIQAQMCKLNEGVTIAQYDKLIEKYIKWSKKNDVETFFARQTPLFTHDTFNISSESDDTIVFVMNLDFKLASIVQLINGLPSKSIIFLLGKPLEPALAGIMDNIRQDLLICSC